MAAAAAGAAIGRLGLVPRFAEAFVEQLVQTDVDRADERRIEHFDARGDTWPVVATAQASATLACCCTRAATIVRAAAAAVCGSVAAGAADLFEIVDERRGGEVRRLGDHVEADLDLVDVERQVLEHERFVPDRVTTRDHRRRCFGCC